LNAAAPGRSLKSEDWNFEQKNNENLNSIFQSLAKNGQDFGVK